jgi:hypothetical protein
MLVRNVVTWTLVWCFGCQLMASGGKTTVYILDKEFDRPEGHGAIVTLMVRRHFNGGIQQIDISNGIGPALLRLILASSLRPEDRIVVNMSWSTAHNPDLDTVFDTLAAKGVVMVAAAGNDGLSLCSYPASWHSIIAVGASISGSEYNYSLLRGRDWKPTDYSNHGACVQFYAPDESAEKIYRTMKNEIDRLLDGVRYGYADQYDIDRARSRMRQAIEDVHVREGTSFAAPQVAGELATILAQNGNWSTARVVAALRTASDDGNIVADAANRAIAQLADAHERANALAWAKAARTEQIGQRLKDGHLSRSGRSVVIAVLRQRAGSAAIGYFVDLLSYPADAPDATEALLAVGRGHEADVVHALIQDGRLDFAGPSGSLLQSYVSVALPILRGYLDKPGYHKHAVQALVSLGDWAVPMLLDDIERGFGQIQAGAAEALSAVRVNGTRAAVIQALLMHLSSPNPSVRRWCAYELSNTNARSAVGPLLSKLSDTDQGVTTAAITALGTLGDAQVLKILERLKTRTPEQESARRDAVERLAAVVRADVLKGGGPHAWLIHSQMWWSRTTAITKGFELILALIALVLGCGVVILLLELFNQAFRSIFG